MHKPGVGQRSRSRSTLLKNVFTPKIEVKTVFTDQILMSTPHFQGREVEYTELQHFRIIRVARFRPTGLSDPQFPSLL